jgi:hypothetical protein
MKLIPIDGLLHLSAGYVIVDIVAQYLPVFPERVWLPSLIGCGVACIIGFLKEVYDWKIKESHQFSAFDLIMTISGAWVRFFIERGAEEIYL